MSVRLRVSLRECGSQTWAVIERPLGPLVLTAAARIRLRPQFLLLTDQRDFTAGHQSSEVGRPCQLSGHARLLQWGRPSTQRPRRPHLPHLTRCWNDGTSTSLGLELPRSQQGVWRRGLWIFFASDLFLRDGILRGCRRTISDAPTPVYRLARSPSCRDCAFRPARHHHLCRDRNHVNLDFAVALTGPP
jgi:hypothetical protein